MSVTIITSAWVYFQKIPKDDFTTKIIQSIAMIELINDFNPKDKKRLYWLRDYTHENIRRSVYELDRYVDPLKGKYKNERYSFNGKEYTQDNLQRYLCLAIEEATAIIYRNYKDFKVETKINLDSYETNNETTDENW